MATISSVEPEAAKASLGFIPDRPYIYEKLTAGEFLRFHAGLYGIDGDGLGQRVREMLELFELGRWEHELVESFSHGMKQRLVMCAAFLHRPQAVLVDEPMVGLDPRGAMLIKSVFRQMSDRGVAILMSTHTLEVAQEMCDRISIIFKGKIIARGTVDELRELAGSRGRSVDASVLEADRWNRRYRRSTRSSRAREGSNGSEVPVPVVPVPWFRSGVLVPKFCFRRFRFQVGFEVEPART